MTRRIKDVKGNTIKAIGQIIGTYFYDLGMKAFLVQQNFKSTNHRAKIPGECDIKRIGKVTEIHNTNCNDVFYLYQPSHVQIIVEISCIFILCLQNPMCTLHLQHVSVLTSHISRAHSYRAGQHRSTVHKELLQISKNS